MLPCNLTVNLRAVCVLTTRKTREALNPPNAKLIRTRQRYGCKGSELCWCDLNRKEESIFDLGNLWKLKIKHLSYLLQNGCIYAVDPVFVTS